jgi:NCS2 family nucleobase:cation symporter-2
MMGVTFASVAPMLAMINAAKEAAGTNFAALPVLATIYGSVLVAGIFAIIVAPLMSRLLRLFPLIVTGSIILVIGLSLMRIGVGWVEGPFTVPNIVDGVFKGMIANPNRDALEGFALSLIVLVVILGVTKFGKGFVANIAVLIGLSSARSSQRWSARWSSAPSPRPPGSARLYLSSSAFRLSSWCRS